MDDKRAKQWYTIADQLCAIADQLLPSMSRVSAADTQVMVKVAAASLLAKAHTDCKAMLILCRHKLADSARILARSVIEACLNLLYIEQKPEEHAELFWAYGKHQRARLYGKLNDIGELSPVAKRKFKELQQFVNKEGRWPRLADMVKELGHEIEKKLHGLFYDTLSSNCHALPLTMDEYYVTYSGGEILVGRNLEKASLFPQIDIPCAFFCGALSSAARIFGIPVPGELATIWDSIQKLALQDGL